MFGGFVVVMELKYIHYRGLMVAAAMQSILAVDAAIKSLMGRALCLVATSIS